MKKKISVRLYRMHDLDLIALFFTINFPFRKVMITSLKEFLKGNVKQIEIPSGVKLNVEKVKYCVLFQLTLDEVRDQDVLNLLSQIPKGMRNSFLKNCMRQQIKGLEMLQIYRTIENGNQETAAKAKSLKFISKTPSKELKPEREVKRKQKQSQKRKTESIFEDELKSPENLESSSNEFLSQFVSLIR